NHTEMLLNQTLNDPDESELGGPYPPGNPLWGNPIKINEMYLSGELEINPYSGRLGGTQPWDFVSNDPALILADEVLEGACRMTGGGVDVDGEIVLETLAIADDTDDKDKYQFGGQIGAPTASQPQPYGEWTHHQQKGPSGSFAFHAGTSSAPESTEILTVTCSDPGCCSPARPAPFKQIDFDGIGTFKNVKGELEDDVTPGVTLHYFRVHVEDIGEPGPGGKQPKSGDCTHTPGTPIVVPDDCETCPAVYQIEIYASDDPTSSVIYSVGGFINGGNLQIHPAIK
ncbi:hypothetical protein KA005_69330, partial [bacterium]|nr:hypothetical protein [bacterium]